MSNPKNVIIDSHSLLQGVLITGKHISIRDNAIVGKNVHISGERISIAGYAEVKGHVKIDSNVQIADLVSVRKKEMTALVLADTALMGDVELHKD